MIGDLTFVTYIDCIAMLIFGNSISHESHNAIRIPHQCIISSSVFHVKTLYIHVLRKTNWNFSQSTWPSFTQIYITNTVVNSELLLFWTLFIVRNSKYKKTTFRKLDVFPSSGEGKETPTVLGPPLERSNLNHWTRLALAKGPSKAGVSLPSPEDGNRSSFPNLLF
jgi:hypothetical protein